VVVGFNRRDEELGALGITMPREKDIIKNYKQLNFNFYMKHATTGEYNILERMEVKEDKTSAVFQDDSDFVDLLFNKYKTMHDIENNICPRKLKAQIIDTFIEEFSTHRVPDIAKRRKDILSAMGSKYSTSALDEQLRERVQTDYSNIVPIIPIVPIVPIVPTKYEFLTSLAKDLNPMIRHINVRIEEINTNAAEVSSANAAAKEAALVANAAQANALSKPSNKKAAEAAESAVVNAAEKSADAAEKTVTANNYKLSRKPLFEKYKTHITSYENKLNVFINDLNSQNIKLDPKDEPLLSYINRSINAFNYVINGLNLDIEATEAEMDASNDTADQVKANAAIEARNRSNIANRCPSEPEGHCNYLGKDYKQILPRLFECESFKDLDTFEICPKDFVIGIAASGTTPYVLGALRACQSRHISTGSISCNANSPISSVSDFPVEVIVGPEFISGSTRLKAGTAQKMVLNMLTTSVMIGLGKVEGNRMVDMQLSNNKLIERGVRMIMEVTGSSDVQARLLLNKFGNVRKAIEAYGNQ